MSLSHPARWGPGQGFSHAASRPPPRPDAGVRRRSRRSSGLPRRAHGQRRPGLVHHRARGRWRRARRPARHPGSGRERRRRHPLRALHDAGLRLPRRAELLPAARGAGRDAPGALGAGQLPGTGEGRPGVEVEDLRLEPWALREARQQQDCDGRRVEPPAVRGAPEEERRPRALRRRGDRRGAPAAPVRQREGRRAHRPGGTRADGARASEPRRVSALPRRQLLERARRRAPRRSPLGRLRRGARGERARAPRLRRGPLAGRADRHAVGQRRERASPSSA